MIEFSKIDSDFSIYRKRKVVLWGCGKGGYRVKSILDGCGIKIAAFIDSHPERLAGEFLGIKVISFQELEERAKGDESYLVQISCDFDDEIISKLEQIGIEYISYSEFSLRTDGLAKYRIIQKHPELRDEFYRQDYIRGEALAEVALQRFLILNDLSGKETINGLISNSNVGNDSLNEFFLGDAILNHSFRMIGEKFLNYMLESKVNLLCGVRDIISQDLSRLFGSLGLHHFWDIEEYWHGGGDVEKIFNKYVASYVASEYKNKKCFANVWSEKMGYYSGGVEFFEKHLKEYLGIDVYEHPFDTEKGYGIIQKENIRIMVYQTEKAEKLKRELAEFVGFGDGLIYQRTNQASQRWYNQAYQKAKKEIQLDKEYFDKCYEGKYMRHFYSNEDIEKFKQKWSKNVREVNG